MLKNYLLRIGTVFLGIYATLWVLIEPLGLFGPTNVFQAVGIWGYLFLAGCSLIAAIIFVALTHKTGNIGRSLIKPEKQHVSINNSIISDKYEFLTEIHNTPLSRLVKVRNRHNGGLYLLKWVKHKEYYDISTIKKISEAYSNSEVSKKAALPIEIFEEPDCYVEVLEYFEGWPLAQVISVNGDGVCGPLLEEWAREILELVFPLHRAGIVHRDITPYNVLVRADNLSLILLDFSNAVTKSQRKMQNILTPGFTAPEQREGNITLASDLYAIGALLYFMSSTRIPPTYEERIYRNKKIILPDMYYRLSSAIHRMLSINPDERFANAMDAYEHIKRHGTTTAITSEPPPLLGKIELPDDSVITMYRNSWQRQTSPRRSGGD